ncbi:uncharacterized protein PG998_002793 [Apiospora kogelbergensis]|uniref:uncharacterized protein n=1 Tax=Apiospora kogelbergensis TaxID=1337665 RepID=UPI00312F83C4
MEPIIFVIQTIDHSFPLPGSRARLRERAAVLDDLEALLGEAGPEQGLVVGVPQLRALRHPDADEDVALVRDEALLGDEALGGSLGAAHRELLERQVVRRVGERAGRELLPDDVVGQGALQTRDDARHGAVDGLLQEGFEGRGAPARLPVQRQHGFFLGRAARLRA